MSTRVAKAPNGQNGGKAAPFQVYVEGARDGEILRRWTRPLSPRLTKALAASLVILGGRRPERARVHLASVREEFPEARGLCILDRDGGSEPDRPTPGLDTFTWSRRHIESYLLVPEAIRRAQRLDPKQSAVLDRLLREHLPRPADAPWERLDAKRLLGPKGPFARELGFALAPGRIARAMRPAELAPEVRDLILRLGDGLGFSLKEPEVSIRLSR